ncbi:hypothetical protein ACOYQJ_26195, partial [Primorskyibacter sp. 2E233]
GNPLRPMPKSLPFGHRPRSSRHLLVLNPDPSMLAALWLQTVVLLEHGNTTDLRGTTRAGEGDSAADHTFLWGIKVG